MMPEGLVKLGFWEEAIGDLTFLAKEESGLVASIGKLKIVFPIEMEEALKAKIGKRVAILRTDESTRQFLCRVISNVSIDDRHLDCGVK